MPIPGSTVNCRGCHDSTVPVGEAIPARKVLGKPNARGWFCQVCAYGERRIRFLTRRQSDDLSHINPIG